MKNNIDTLLKNKSLYLLKIKIYRHKYYIVHEPT